MSYLYGHRGAKGQLPENSLSGFRFLRALGIQRVELDAQLSADNEIVIFHDTSLTRTTQKSGLVYTKTVAQLKALNIASNNPQWRYKESVPTLLEVLTEWPELLSIQLDTKRIPLDRVGVFVKRLEEILHAFKVRDFILTSEYNDILRAVKKSLPHIAMGLIATPNTHQPLRQTQSLGCDYLIADHRICDDKFIDAAHKDKVKVSAWTVNEFKVFRPLYQANIHSIITDFPAQALAWQQLIGQENS